MTPSQALTGVVMALSLGMITNSAAFALEVPKGGRYDRRVKFINYNPAEVVKLVGHYGFSTHIQFSPAEEVRQIAMGDEDAWKVAPINNHLFIKPTADLAATNMTVLTNRHAYNFELSAQKPQNWAQPHSNAMYFQINFHYPEEEAARAKAQAEARALQERLHEHAPPLIANWNYWAKGSQEVTPNRAYDDGRFTYLKFANNREMPAIYAVNPDGSESLVNTHIDPQQSDTIVVHKIARQLVLRKGNSVACVFNQSYDPDGIPNNTGTTRPGVKRVIKGDNHG